MTVILLVEGATETALKRHLKRFLDHRATRENKPRLALRTKPLRTVPSAVQFQKRVRLELGSKGVKAVVGLLDVYPKFESADEAKEFTCKAAGFDERFFAHAAQYDVEAWLLPYWEFICHRIGVTRSRPGANPEQVNHMSPPSRRLEELYRIAKRKYKKPLDDDSYFGAAGLEYRGARVPRTQIAFEHTAQNWRSFSTLTCASGISTSGETELTCPTT